jgi:hypothetical protein
VRADADREAANFDTHADPAIPVFDTGCGLPGHRIRGGQEKR